MGKKCTECKYCLRVDSGYSNWTVEGTTAYCLLGMNPEFPTDNWYGEAKEYEFAEECIKFIGGEPTHIDVDREYGSYENYGWDDELRAMLLVLDQMEFRL